MNEFKNSVTVYIRIFYWNHSWTATSLSSLLNLWSLNCCFCRTVTCWSSKISSSTCTPFTFVLILMCCIYNVLLPFVCINLWWTLIVAECFTHKNRLTQWTSLQVKVSNITANAYQLIPWIASDSSTIYCMFPILHVLHPTENKMLD